MPGSCSKNEEIAGGHVFIVGAIHESPLRMFTPGAAFPRSIAEKAPSVNPVFQKGNIGIGKKEGQDFVSRLNKIEVAFSRVRPANRRRRRAVRTEQIHFPN
jgi:hypothetical protein